jgi:hypothetical protein
MTSVLWNLKRKLLSLYEYLTDDNFYFIYCPEDIYTLDTNDLIKYSPSVW